jgi:hypothetical protein
MKKLTMVGAIVGSCAGSYIPVLWGGSLLSMSSLLLATVGGFAGIWIGYKIAVWMDI